MTSARKRVTQSDIAARLGISRALVSCALNGRPDGFGNIVIKPELREEIRRTAESLGYKPNRAALALRRGGSSRTIGVVSALTESQVANRLVAEMNRLIRQYGYTPMPQLLDISLGAKLTETVHLLLDYHVDGIVLHAMSGVEDRPEAERLLRAAGCPVVHISSELSDSFPNITLDFFSAAREIARHVLASGRRDLLGVCFHHVAPSVKIRFDGVRAACAEVEGASFNIFSLPGKLYDHNQNQEEAGYLLTKRFLEERRPEAVFYSNDHLACGGLNALAESGVAVPGEMFVCGFDGLDVTGYTIPPLTTAIQPVYECAETAIVMLLEMISNPDYRPPEMIKLPCRIALRRSTNAS